MNLSAIVRVFIIHLTFITASFGQTAMNDQVTKIVNEIATTNRYDESYTIGIGGIISTQYQLFQQLAQLATPQQLVDLINHTNAVVRLYAYQALRGKGVNIHERILNQFAKDKTLITVMRGCIMEQQPVSALINHKLIAAYKSSN